MMSSLKTPKGLFKCLTVLTVMVLVAMATLLQLLLTADFRIITISENELNAHRNVTFTTDLLFTNNGGALLFKNTSETNNSLNLPSVRTERRLILPSKPNFPKVYHVGFLKVHKAGSTTMQNIFFRFGLKNNLTFVLPKKTNYFLSTQSAIPIKDGNHWDILACHSVYSRKLFGSVLPVDSVNIGIIREPIDRMISAAYYFRDVWKSPLLVKVPRLNYIQNLINYPQLYEKLPFSKTKNAMGKDFGFAEKVTIDDTEAIARHLEMLKNDFKLVLVMERFDESLILLKRTLNWDLSEILFLTSNSHSHKPVSLSDAEKVKFRTTCFLDYAIYDTFYKIFEERIRQEDETFKAEVTHFRHVLSTVKVFCDSDSDEDLPRILEIEASSWNEKFKVTSMDCRYMKMPELRFLSTLKVRHIAMNDST